ncbi:MAG: chorismate transformation enzyme, FkbO/Hyg5 family [Gammaproteobacteria bacterium]
MPQAPAPVPCSYDVHYEPESDAPLAPDVLACIHFGVDEGRGAGPGDRDPRRFRVRLRQFGAAPLMEVWRSTRPVEYGWSDGFGYATNGDVLMGHLDLPEAEIEDLDRASARAYVHVEALLHRTGYPSWLRIWNYLSHINRGEGDKERYKVFTHGRYRALALKPGFEATLPAATAIGTPAGGLLVYFLAARSPGVQAENPRQVSAFHYPRQYGPRGPSFSRATGKQWAGGRQLFISGTAAVVGHATVHEGDALGQLEETARNVRALLESTGMPKARPLALKLYVREPEHFDAVRRRALELFGADAPLLCLQGDVCREHLLLEIEALYVEGG